MSRAEHLEISMTEDGMTHEEIGLVLGISPARVRQIEMQALMKLKHPRLKDQWREVLETKAVIDRRMNFNDTAIA